MLRHWSTCGAIHVCLLLLTCFFERKLNLLKIKEALQIFSCGLQGFCPSFPISLSDIGLSLGKMVQQPLLKFTKPAVLSILVSDLLPAMIWKKTCFSSSWLHISIMAGPNSKTPKWAAKSAGRMKYLNQQIFQSALNTRQRICIFCLQINMICIGDYQCNCSIKKRLPDQGAG